MGREVRVDSSAAVVEHGRQPVMVRRRGARHRAGIRQGGRR